MLKLNTYKLLKALFISALFVYVNTNYCFGQPSTIELVHADKVTNAILFPNAVKVVGNVHFKHENRNLFCDSAYFHQTKNWIKAFGHVQINQADTLNLFCDSLHYNGNTNLGILKSNVRFRDNEFKLTTDSLEFDATNSIGYYTTGAKISSINQDLKLTSIKGYYFANSKTFFFKDSVKVNHPNYNLTADTLEFRTTNQTVYFHGPTTIILDSTTVNCKKGYFESNNEFLNLWQGATIINDTTSTLYADSLVYNKSTELAEGFYNVSVYDSIKKIQLKSEYLKKYPNNSKILLKNNARIYQYSNNDTLFLKADIIEQQKDSATNKTISVAQNNVIIINKGVVGICDSVYYNETDSIIKLRKTPLMWQDSTQLSADSININLINNDIDKIFLINKALVVNKHDSLYYDQLAGKKITAYFKKGEINNIFIDENAQTLYYPSEEKIDSLGNKTKSLRGKNYLECNQIFVYFKKSEIQKITFLDKPDASFFPLNQIPKKELYIPNFIWKIDLKPSSNIPK